MADWMLRLTKAHKGWGCGLSFPYLRNLTATAGITRVLPDLPGIGGEPAYLP